MFKTQTHKPNNSMSLHYVTAYLSVAKTSLDNTELKVTYKHKIILSGTITYNTTHSKLHMKFWSNRIFLLLKLRNKVNLSFNLPLCSPKKTSLNFLSGFPKSPEDDIMPLKNLPWTKNIALTKKLTQKSLSVSKLSATPIYHFSATLRQYGTWRHWLHSPFYQ